MWFGILIAAFLAQNIWLFVLFVVVAGAVVTPVSLNGKVLCYLSVLCVIPLLPIKIPSFFGVNYFFSLTYPRLLVLVIFFVPFFFRQFSIRLFSLTTDKYMFFFVCIVVVASFRDNALTHAVRYSFLVLIDIFIPYFLISRALSTTELLRKALFILFIGLVPMAIIGIFETIRHWHLFSDLSYSLVKFSKIYDMRSNSLRASGAFYGPIVLGYAMVIAYSLLLFLEPYCKSKKLVLLVKVILVTCLLATMSRGAWVGFAVLILAFVWTGKATTKKISVYVLITLLAVPVLSFTSFGKTIIDLLPYIGNARSDTITYRERLVEQAWIVFQRNPWFGSTTYLKTPEMESMRQGQGIIDLVNTYLQVVLPYGIIGLIVFTAIFLVVLIRCFLMIKRLPKTEIELILMGRFLFAILLSIIIMIGTVSSIDYIPVFYWAFIGLIVAYLNVSEKAIAANKKLRASQRLAS